MNLRKSIHQHLDSISSSSHSSESSVHHIRINPNNKVIFIKGYKPRQLVSNIPDYGVIALNRIDSPGKASFSNRDYFIFRKTSGYLNLVKMDTAFVRTVSSNLAVITGSGVVMYPLSPRDWQQILYENRFIQGDSDIRIYPFGFISQNNSWAISANIDDQNSNTGYMRLFGITILFGDQKFVIGRVYIPVLGEAHGEFPYFAIDIFQTNDIFSLNHVMSKIFLALIILFLVMELLVIRRLGKFGTEINNIIIEKFDVLRKGIRQISSGNLDYKLKMGGEDEFVELAGHFNEMGDKLKTTIAEVRDRDRLDHELKIARQVQLSLLPAKLPEIEGYQIAAAIKTANEIGGDFYDILPLNDDSYLFTIGDVSGKGSSAAFYMAQFISLLRYSPQFTDSPVEIAERLNAYFSKEIKDRQIFVTSIIGVLNVKNNTIKFVRNGHTPPILIPGDTKKDVAEITSDGLGIGLTKTDQTFKNSLKEKTVRLKENDKFILYTDGIIEAAIASDDEEFTEVFGEDKFNFLLNKIRNENAGTIKKEVCNVLDDFYKSKSPIDDYTLLIIQRSGESK